MKKILLILLTLTMLSSCLIANAAADDRSNFDLNCESAVLMEASTGNVLYEKFPNVALPPASVTKIMTILLTMEAIDNGNLKMTDTLQASGYAASMGGSQVFIEENEEMTVEDLLKSVVVASANDAAVVLAENISGSVDAFVHRMNERALELGMKNTNFENPTGLDDNTTNHKTSALDIAIMSRELLKHETVLNYTGIWMDTIRDGQFGLTNTNRLIRFYNGANGLKTGSTSKAKFCISATAKRDGMQLIAVIMGAPTRDIRNDAAKKLLDYGFANFSLNEFEEGSLGKVKVLKGTKNTIDTYYPSTYILTEKGQGKNIEKNISIPDALESPIKIGQKIGEITYTLNGNVVGRADITAGETAERLTFPQILSKLLKKYLYV